MVVTGPSLGTAVGTLAETSNKHNIVVKTHYDALLKWVNNDQQILLKDKARFAMLPHEIAVILSNYLFAEETADPMSIRKAAYPPVVTNLANLRNDVRLFLATIYDSVIDPDTLREIKTRLPEYATRLLFNGPIGVPLPPVQPAPDDIRQLPYFSFGGVALGNAFAHPSSGDTVAGTQIGGIITVQNGAFPIHTNDMVQWYFQFESPFFDENGDRKFRVVRGLNPEDPRVVQYPDGAGFVNIANIDGRQVRAALNAPGPRGAQDHDRVNAENRKRRHETEYGSFPGQRYNNETVFDDTKQDLSKASSVIHPKSFTHNGDNDRFFDKLRVFGIALGSARPWDKVDIMICRQSV